MSPAPAITFESASLGYRRRIVLDDVTLAFRLGSFTGIVGPNGSGKTTLLRAAIGLLPPLRGAVTRAESGGRPLRIGYVPQRARLDPIFPLRAGEIVAMGRYPHVGALRSLQGADRAAIDAATRAVAISDLLDRPFRELSGGQQQRVLIARALAAEPDVVALDEPTNGMDLVSERQVVDVLVRWNRERGTTILLVTHLLHLVADEATDLVLVPSREMEGARLLSASREQALDSATLTRFYGSPVAVYLVAGRRVVLAETPR